MTLPAPRFLGWTQSPSLSSFKNPYSRQDNTATIGRLLPADRAPPPGCTPLLALAVPALPCPDPACCPPSLPAAPGCPLSLFVFPLETAHHCRKAARTPWNSLVLKSLLLCPHNPQSALRTFVVDFY